MTHDELLAKVDSVFYEDEGGTQLDLAGFNNQYRALRVVVELAIKQLETKDMPAEQVGWFNEGYNLAMDNIIDAIERELG